MTLIDEVYDGKDRKLELFHTNGGNVQISIAEYGQDAFIDLSAIEVDTLIEELLKVQKIRKGFE